MQGEPEILEKLSDFSKSATNDFSVKFLNKKKKRMNKQTKNPTQNSKTALWALKYF